MKIVLDTNIYIAAFLAKGLASDVLELASKEEIEIYTSNEILKEVQTRLVRKLKMDEDYVADYVFHASKSLKIVKPRQEISVIKNDPSDNKILECPVEVDADLIVSMDKHLIKLKKFGKAGIVHPKTLTWIIPKFFERGKD